jgi:hypothetical protein
MSNAKIDIPDITAFREAVQDWCEDIACNSTSQTDHEADILLCMLTAALGCLPRVHIQPFINNIRGIIEDPDDPLYELVIVDERTDRLNQLENLLVMVQESLTKGNPALLRKEPHQPLFRGVPQQ